MSESFGIMEGAFFVPRTELLSWVNEFLQLNLTKIEQVGTGAVFCQIMDAITNNGVPMNKIRWKARSEYEYVENYKVLQQSFDKMQIKKYIEVEKLIKLKYQDNLEFLQWMKRYFDLHHPQGEYDAVGRRGGQSLLGAEKGGAVASTGAKMKPKTTVVAPITQKAATGSAKKATTTATSKVAASKVGASSEGTEELRKQLEEAKSTNEVLERERDFYFGKLRDIEVLMQNNADQENEVVQTVQRILYATEDEKVEIDDKGQLHIAPLNDGEKGEEVEPVEEEEHKE